MNKNWKFKSKLKIKQVLLLADSIVVKQLLLDKETNTVGSVCIKVYNDDDDDDDDDDGDDHGNEDDGDDDDDDDFDENCDNQFDKKQRQRP